MGLTMAEAFILIAFALLLLFAFWQWEKEKENTPEVMAFRELPLDQRQTFLYFSQDDSMKNYIDLKDKGVDFATCPTIEKPQEKWRFIDQDEVRRLIDAASKLPEDMQRDLADMVESKQAHDILKEMAILEELVESGQKIDNLIADHDTARKVEESGHSVEELVEAADAIEVLDEKNRSMEELLTTTETLTALEDSGHSVEELVDAADSIDALTREGRSMDDLLETAETLAVLKNSDHSVEELMIALDVIKVLVRKGRNMKELLATAEILETLEDSGHSIEKLVDAANSIDALAEEGRSIDELLATAQTLASLERAGQSLEDISRKIHNAEAQEEALVKALRNKLGELVSRVGGRIDDHGAIILPDTILFEQGEARITPVMEQFLVDACSPWLTVVKNSGVDIAEVKIEGHASSEWSSESSASQAYLGNLDLSQRRSQAVLRSCLGFVSEIELLEWARTHMIAVGYSSVRPVMRNGQEDRAASRRVVLAASLNRENLIEQIEEDTIAYD